MLAGDDLTIVLFFVGTAVSFSCAAMSSAGWKHPALIAGLFGLATVCFLFGAAWPIIKEALPALVGPVNLIATNPVSWFSVLILGMTASILLPRRRNLLPRFEPEPKTDQVIGRAKEMAPEPPQEPKEKILVTVDPIYLMKFYEDRTSIQGDQLAKNYIGKWLRVSGSVGNASVKLSSVVATIRLGDGKFLMLLFSEEWIERVSVLIGGQTIEVIGQIDQIADYSVTLKNCELTD